MIKKMLEQIADKIMAMDEASLTEVLPEYKQAMEKFEPTEEWEKSVIIYFLINSVRVKNTIFNDNIMKSQEKPTGDKPESPLKLIKK